MSCNEILPKIAIQATTIEAAPSKNFFVNGKPAKNAAFLDLDLKEKPDSDFSTLGVSADFYRLNLGYETQINVEEFLGRFNLSEVITATKGVGYDFTVRILITNKPEVNNLIVDIIKVIKELSRYLYNNTQTVSGKEVIDALELAAQTEYFVGDTVVDAAIDKVRSYKLSDIVSDDDEPEDEETQANKILLKFLERETMAVEAAEKLLLGELTTSIILALTNNRFEGLRDRLTSEDDTGALIDAFTPFVSSYPATTLNVDVSKVKLYGFPPKSKVVTNNMANLYFTTSQLENLYITMVPAFEYRQDGQLLFSFRELFNIPLLEEFKRQTYYTKLVSETETVLNEQNSQTESTLEDTTLDFLGVPPTATGIEVYDAWLNSAQQVFLDIPQNDDLGYTIEDKIGELFLNKIRNQYGKKGFDSFVLNLKPEQVLVGPWSSVGYNKEINGMFFIDRKKILKAACSYPAFVEMPELYKTGILSLKMEKVIMSKDKEIKRESLEDPYVLKMRPSDAAGLPAEMVFRNDESILGYYFSDFYDSRDFKYEIFVTVKNPLASMLEYVIPFFAPALSTLSVIINTFENKNDFIEINPLNGFFTDEYQASDYYKQDQATYNYYRAMLRYTIDILLPGSNLIKKTLQGQTDVSNFISKGGGPFDTPPVTPSMQQALDSFENRPLVNYKQFKSLLDKFNDIYNILETVAETEGISITDGQSGYGSIKALKKGGTPIKTFTYKMDKGYIHEESNVFFDYILGTNVPTNNSGFFVNPETLKARINQEGIILSSYEKTQENTTYDSEDPVSLSPIGLDIDNARLNLAVSAENAEDVFVRALLSAAQEEKTPTKVYNKESDIIAELLQLENTTIEGLDNKVLKPLLKDDDFVPTSLGDSRTAKSAKKLNDFLKALKQASDELKEAATQEMAQEKLESLAKKLFLGDIIPSITNTKTNFGAWGVVSTFLLAKLKPIKRLEDIAIKLDLPPVDLPLIDSKHGNLGLALGEEEFVKNPASFVTRFLNSLQLEFLLTFDENMNPVWRELNLDGVEEFLGGSIFWDNRLVRLSYNAGYAPDVGKIYNEYFMLSRKAEPAPAPTANFTFLDNSKLWSAVLGFDVQSPPPPTRKRLTREQIRQNIASKSPDQQSGTTSSPTQASSVSTSGTTY